MLLPRHRGCPAAQLDPLAAWSCGQQPAAPTLRAEGPPRAPGVHSPLPELPLNKTLACYLHRWVFLLLFQRDLSVSPQLPLGEFLAPRWQAGRAQVPEKQQGQPTAQRGDPGLCAQGHSCLCWSPRSSSSPRLTTMHCLHQRGGWDQPAGMWWKPGQLLPGAPGALSPVPSATGSRVARERSVMG